MTSTNDQIFADTCTDILLALVSLAKTEDTDERENIRADIQTSCENLAPDMVDSITTVLSLVDPGAARL